MPSVYYLTDFLKAHVRDLFKDTFNLKTDYDIALCPSANLTLVARYETATMESVPGPDPANIQFNFIHTPVLHSKWNRHVFRLLYEKLMQRREAENWDLPQMSEHYYIDMITDRFQRLVTRWLESQRHTNINGDFESLADVEIRITAERREKEATARRAQRRRYVCILFSSSNKADLSTSCIRHELLKCKG